MPRPITVLIVDDSALIRQLLTTMLGADPEIEVLGAAADPLQARQMIKELNPNVVTLDVEMPHMDGLAFLEKIMTLRPMPVVMVSSLTQRGADATMRALELGAVDFVAKPTSGLRAGLDALREDIVDKVKAAARAQLPTRAAPSGPAAPPASRGTTRADLVVALGASTGGVVALQAVLSGLPEAAPATLVTQHMPPEYTARFASRLDGRCAMTVVEASDQMPLQPGYVFVAPGGRQLELARAGGHFVCHVHDGPPVSGHKPSVDVLFRSVARHAGAQAVGAILTGMGNDGAAGLLDMRQAGATTLGEAESTCVVYGMPRAAMETGAVGSEHPLGDLAGEILKACAGAGPRRARRAKGAALVTS